MSELKQFSLVKNAEGKPVLIIKAEIDNSVYKIPNEKVNARIFVDRHDLESMSDIIDIFRGNLHG